MPEDLPVAEKGVRQLEKEINKRSIEHSSQEKSSDLI
jgi:hypothetical protein